MCFPETEETKLLKNYGGKNNAQILLNKNNY